MPVEPREEASRPELGPDKFTQGVEMVSELPLRPLGRSDIEVPALGFGGAPLGDLYLRIPEAQAQKTLQAAWACGVRYFDTAPWYGHGLSEHRIGHLLRQQDSNAFFCSTKVGRVYSRFRGDAAAFDSSPWVAGLPFTLRFDYTYDGVMRSYEDSLQRLGLNRVHALVIHDLDSIYHQTEENIAEKFKQLESGWKALDELKRSGEILAIGAGISEDKMMLPFLERVPLDFFLVAMPYTLMDQDVLDREFPECEKHGLGIIIGAPYASGILATGPVENAKYDYSPATPEALEKVRRMQDVCARHRISLKAAALQFPLGHPLVASIIPGAFTAEQVRENRELMDSPIPADFWTECKQEKLLRADAPVP